MKILSYGALRIEHKNLQNQVHRLNLMVECLLQETTVQNKIISQLKLLHESQAKALKKSKVCDRGHYGCQIVHARFNLINSPEKIPVSQNLTSDVKTVYFKNEKSFFKVMSKKVDIIQAKYGMPTAFKHKIMVASGEDIVVSDISKTGSPRKASSTQRMLWKFVPYIIVNNDRKPSSNWRSHQRITNLEPKNVILSSQAADRNLETVDNTSRSDRSSCSSDSDIESETLSCSPMDTPKNIYLKNACGTNAEDSSATNSSAEADHLGESENLEVESLMDEDFGVGDTSGGELHINEAGACEAELHNNAVQDYSDSIRPNKVLQEVSGHGIQEELIFVQDDLHGNMDDPVSTYASLDELDDQFADHSYGEHADQVEYGYYDMDCYDVQCDYEDEFSDDFSY